MFLNEVFGIIFGIIQNTTIPRVQHKFVFAENIYKIALGCILVGYTDHMDVVFTESWNMLILDQNLTLEKPRIFFERLKNDH